MRCLSSCDNSIDRFVSWALLRLETKNFMEESELCNTRGSSLRVACLIIVIQRHDEQKFLEQRTASIFEYSSHSIFAPTACPPPLFRCICSRLKCTRSVDVKSNRIRRNYARSIVTLNRRRIDGRNVVFVRGDRLIFIGDTIDRTGRYVAGVRNKSRHRYHRQSLLRLFYWHTGLFYCISIAGVIT